MFLQYNWNALNLKQKINKLNPLSVMYYFTMRLAIKHCSVDLFKYLYTCLVNEHKG